MCQSSLFFFSCNLSKKRLWQRCFSCEFCEIFKNNFFYRTSPVTASIADTINPNHLICTAVKKVNILQWESERVVDSFENDKIIINHNKFQRLSWSKKRGLLKWISGNKNAKIDVVQPTEVWKIKLNGKLNFNQHIISKYKSISKNLSAMMKVKFLNFIVESWFFLTFRKMLIGHTHGKYEFV